MQISVRVLSIIRYINTTSFLFAFALLAATLGTHVGEAGALLPLPDKPSLVVLPFTNLSGNQDGSYRADGLTDGLITDLSSVSGIFLIARNSSFHYRDRKLKPSKISSELGVKWLLFGTVEAAGEAYRVTVRLVDGQSGREAWTQAYERPRKEMLSMLGEIRTALLQALGVELTSNELANFQQPETNRFAAYDAFLKGLYHYHRRTREDFSIAVLALTRAIEMDPGYARAHATLAALYIHTWRAAWHVALGFDYGDRSRPRELAETHIETAMLRPSALALRWKARLLTFKRRAYEQAVAFAELAIALEPNSPEGYVGLNYVLGYMHELDRAEQAIKTAIRLDPHHSTYAARLAWIDYYRGNFEAAVSRLRRAISREPDSYIYYVSLISALGHLGQIDEAALAISEMQATRARLGMTPVLLYYLRYWPFKNEADRDLMRKGLEKAGFRD